MRIHELAKELGVTSKDILASLQVMGYEGKTASSTVPEEALPRLRAAGGKVKPGTRPRTATEAGVAARRPAREVEAGDGQVEAGVAQALVEAPEEARPEPAAPPEAPAEATPAPVAEAPPAEVPTPVRVPRGATPQDLAERLGVSATDVVKVLFAAGEMVSVTQSLPDEAIELVAAELGRPVEVVGAEEEPEAEAEEPVDESRLQPRPPVVTVMGHVDHGKTLLLDAIRKTDVVAREYGGITQHIGAYQVHLDGRAITFIDTPGHEAFTAMRARGAQVTDIAVLVVAADDGVMPQTVEALNHARAAGVPIVVAVNKIDKPEADPQRVRQQLTELGVVPAEWGGDYEFVDISAKTGQNLDRLLETILVVWELHERRADPTGPGRGVALEAHLDRGRGPVATVLVQRGTFRVGDAIVCGTAYGRIRAMLDENGRPVREAGPSKPVQVLGWSQVPQAGDEVRAVADEREARRIAQEREARLRAAELAATRPTVSLADLLARAREGEAPTLNLIVKADVQGSLEAILEALDKLPQDEVRIEVLHKGVGGITESDVTLAAASRALVVGFNVRPDPGAREVAEREGVEVRTYRIIYELVDDMKRVLSGLLAPEIQEVELGRAEVRALFRVPRVGVVAGCMVTDGTIARGARARVVRDGVVVYTGRIASLRRFKDDVREVAEGYECGIGLENFQDIHEGDVIETFEVREVARTLA
ncbi:MAG TPA: translation initiation factor IF-2 [Actinomycetota bacterium]|nr:translation initiation factor IF-2 [Actinomycetota bacterium]